jgi:tetratricopeptide (TPR) repeat protein
MSRIRCSALAMLCVFVGLNPPGAAVAAEDAGTLSPFAGGAGCRAMALGGAFVAMAEDAAALTWNPAGLGGATRSGFEVAHTERTSVGAVDEYAALVLPSWRWGSAALAIRHLGVGGIERRDERNVLLEGEASSSETEIALGYGRSVSEVWSVGAAVKMQRQSLGGFSAGGVGADLGVQASLGAALGGRRWLDGVTWGLAARNLLEPSLRLDRESVPDPRLWRTGLAWRGALGRLPEARLAWGLDQAAGISPRLHAGAEVRIHPLLVLRAGFDRDRPTAGLGVSWHDLDVSYAFQDGSVGPVHRIGLAHVFGSTVGARREASQRAEEEAIQARLDREFQQRRAGQIDQLLQRAEQALGRAAFDDVLEMLGAAALLDSTDSRVTALEARCQRELGTHHERAGDFAAAAQAFGRALAIAPGDTAAREGERRARAAYDHRAERVATRRGQFDAGLGAFAAGDLGRARSAFEALAASDPADSQSTTMLRRVQQAIGVRNTELLRQARASLASQETDEASRLLARVRALDSQAPGLAELETALADAGRRSGASASAVAAPSAESRREAEALFRRGALAMSAGRVDDALRFWELALSLDPGHSGAGRALNREYLARGMEAYAAGHLDEAIGNWEKALRADPRDRRAAGFLTRARERELRTRELSGQNR